MDGLSWLNQLPEDQAREEFLRVCGSMMWAQTMTAGRPFREVSHLQTTAKKLWENLTPEDWKEAFSKHPKIGDRATLRKKFSEQAQVAQASEAVLADLEKGNAEYDRKFGFVFLICATGKSAEEMLTALNHRMNNDPRVEIHVAAGEQALITKLRLEKLINDHGR